MITIIHVLILLTLLKDLTKSFGKKQMVNLFIMGLILDEIITVLMFLGDISGASNNYFYFYASAAFDILIGLFFWIKEDNPKLSFKLVRDNTLT